MKIFLMDSNFIDVNWRIILKELLTAEVSPDKLYSQKQK